MLHLAGRVAFGVDVADLFQLERPLQGDGVVDAPPQEEEVLAVVEFGGQRLVIVVARGQHLPRLLGQLG